VGDLIFCVTGSDWSTALPRDVAIVIESINGNAGTQQPHDYLRTYIQPLLRVDKQLDLKDTLHHVIIRKPKIVEQLGNQQVRHMV
jgi:hypothetical protein